MENCTEEDKQKIRTLNNGPLGTVVEVKKKLTSDGREMPPTPWWWGSEDEITQNNMSAATLLRRKK